MRECFGAGSGREAACIAALIISHISQAPFCRAIAALASFSAFQRRTPAHSARPSGAEAKLRHCFTIYKSAGPKGSEAKAFGPQGGKVCLSICWLPRPLVNQPCCCSGTQYPIGLTSGIVAQQGKGPTILGPLLQPLATRLTIDTSRPCAWPSSCSISVFPAAL